MDKKVKEVVEAPKVAPKKESEAAIDFKKTIAAYKEQSPIKYEMKREALEAKLATL